MKDIAEIIKAVNGDKTNNIAQAVKAVLETIEGKGKILYN